jgi:hypothetical protein
MRHRILHLTQGGKSAVHLGGHARDLVSSAGGDINRAEVEIVFHITAEN